MNAPLYFPLKYSPAAWEKDKTAPKKLEWLTGFKFPNKHVILSGTWAKQDF